jgi:hypothetical protein
MWDGKKAVEYLNAHGGDVSLGRCAEYVRKAVEAGGVLLVHHVSAKDYGSSLEKVGFRAIPTAPVAFVAGDVAIIQPIIGHPHGHMTMFNGTIWISDFKQLHGLYPGPTYRAAKPPFVIYHNALLIAAPPDSIPNAMARFA